MEGVRSRVSEMVEEEGEGGGGGRGWRRRERVEGRE